MRCIKRLLLRSILILAVFWGGGIVLFSFVPVPFSAVVIERDGVFGVEAAAQRYFGKPASRLTLPEAALLAAVLPNPIRFKASVPSGYVHSRQVWILRQMRQLGGEGYMREQGLY